MKRAVYSAAIAAILTCGAALRFFFLEGISGGDDVRYLTFAERLWSLEPIVEIDHAAGRFLFLVLIGVPLKIGGHALYASIFNVLLASITDLLITTYAWRALGVRAALICAVMTAFDPITWLNAGRIVPDTALTLFIVAGAILTFYAQNKRIAFAAGAAFGLAYAMKDPGILFLPAAAAALWLAGNRKLIPFLAAGAASIFVLECFIALLATGDALYRAHATALKHNTTIPEYELFEAAGATFTNVELIGRRAHLLLMPILAGIPILIATTILRPQFRWWAAGALFFVVFMIFGTSSLTRWAPLPFHYRYFQPAVPLVAIATAALLHPIEWTKRTAARIAIPISLALLIGLIGRKGVENLSGVAHRAPHLRAVRDAIELFDHEKKPFFVPPCLYPALRFVLSPAHRERAHPFPEGDLTHSGFYISFDKDEGPVKGCIDAAKQAQLAVLPLRLKMQRDDRRLFQSRTSHKYRPFEPALLVLEREVLSGAEVR